MVFLDPIIRSINSVSMHHFSGIRRNDEKSMNKRFLNNIHGG